MLTNVRHLDLKNLENVKTAFEHVSLYVGLVIFTAAGAKVICIWIYVGKKLLFFRLKFWWEILMSGLFSRLKRVKKYPNYAWNVIFLRSFARTHWSLGEFFLILQLHSRTENLKKSRPKKLVKSNKSISQKKIFCPNSILFFCYFKNGQKSIFELGKSLKLPKM